MKYALLIYSETSGEEYHRITTGLRQPGAAQGPWTDYARAAREAGVLAGAEQLAHSETATTVRYTDDPPLITDQRKRASVKAGGVIDETCGGAGL